MNNSHGLMKDLKGILKEKYDIAFTENTETSIVNILTNEFTMENTTKTAVEIKYELYTPIREDLYDYLIS